MSEPQQAVLNTLFLVYLIAVLINGVISGVLYARQRDALTRAQVLIWAATFGGLVVQGLAGPALPTVLIGLVAVFMISYAIANLLSIVSGVELRRRRCLTLLGVGIGVSLLALAAELPFAVVTLPVLIGVAYPLLSTATEESRSFVTIAMRPAGGKITFALLKCGTNPTTGNSGLAVAKNSLTCLPNWSRHSRLNFPISTSVALD